MNVTYAAHVLRWKKTGSAPSAAFVEELIMKNTSLKVTLWTGVVVVVLFIGLNNELPMGLKYALAGAAFLFAAAIFMMFKNE